MSAYVEYSYYTNTYLAGLTPTISDSASFNFFEKKAENLVNRKTLGDYLNVTDANAISKIKDCICALTDNFYQEQSAKGSSGMIKQSENVGGHSVSYVVSASYYANTRDDILREYLWDLGLIRSRKVFGINEG